MPKKPVSSQSNRKPASTRAPGTKAVSKKAAPARRIDEPREEWHPPDVDRLPHSIIPYLLAVAAIYLAACFITIDLLKTDGGVGVVGAGIRGLLCGLFGWAAFLTPLFVLYHALNWKKNAVIGAVWQKTVFSFLCLTLISVLTQTFYLRGTEAAAINIPEMFGLGREIKGGGAVGGFIGSLLYRGVGFTGSVIIIPAMLAVFVLFLTDLTPRVILIQIRYSAKRARERRAGRAERLERFRNTGKAAGGKIASAPAQYPEVYKNGAVSAAGVPAGDGAGVSSPGKRRRKSDADVDVPIDDESETIVESPPPGRGADKPQAADFAEDGLEMSGNAIDPSIFDAVLSERRKQNPGGGVSGEETDQKNTDSGVLPINDGTEVLLPLRPELIAAALNKSAESKTFDELSADELDLSKIFVNPSEEGADGGEDSGGEPGEDDEAEIEITVERRRVSETVIPPYKKPLESEKSATGFPVNRPGYIPSEPIPYKFPPFDLLKIDPAPPDDDIAEELQSNAVKLVDTLTSFKVRTKIVNVSRGPTITRYELLPDDGIKVRSIALLIDDIALKLATTGVRIEAPIPGKSAVGVEVPNKVVATVYARELIEADKFQHAPSKLTSCLGVDVAGSPIYMDITKMPHLLIAGATGMGKSVCINSILISLLYKANPDELKLMLIDPKRVELNVYNGIPHLLVPVVSDPKKAAGSLSWAVSEMERRFGMIEEAGVRDIKKYNEVTANDPDREFMPHIVIIIDELADLMMTAPGDVEDSICRLAQKARAAGMHLIIGTQRPSVDVITGLIKANIPSRIAFTVASQVDSRTIIDMVGAEKLIGRGDMLYAPVGISKPVRVQGAFVSEGEVEDVVEYIRASSGMAEYSNDIIDSIEREAARCGTNGKKSAASADDDGADEDFKDSMLRPALELAVESGKISTSLIQRRLSLGYGRAAKLIDRMERLGYVSPPEGQKPREVLITKQQFMEMVLGEE